MTVRPQLVDEGIDPFAVSGLGILIKLPSQKDSRMQGYQAEKTRFHFGVTVDFQFMDVGIVGVHSYLLG